MFTALPNVRKLELSLPGNIPLDAILFDAITKGASCRFRFLHIGNSKDGDGNDIPPYGKLLDFLRDQKSGHALDAFEGLRISTHDGSLRYKNQFGRILGEKLIWDD